MSTLRTMATAVGAFVLGTACTAEVDSSQQALGTAPPALCEPEHATTLRVTAPPGEDLGTMTFLVTGDGIDVSFEAYAGWEFADLYVGVGPDASSLTWFFINATWWVDGFITHAELSIPATDMGVGCGQQVKVIVQGYGRHAGVDERVFFSALQQLGGDAWGWWGFYEVCCAPVSEGCTLTQGYWKNHAEAWPVTELALGQTTYSAAQLMTLLQTSPRGDASLVLAHQLIAALLNEASGATPAADLAAAHTWLATYGSVLPYGTRASSIAGQQATFLAGSLGAYNEGMIGPGHCVEECD